MKSIRLIYMISLMLFGVLVCNVCEANAIEDVPGDGFYADRETQEYVLSRMETDSVYLRAKEQGVEVVVESIAPLYDVKYRDYAETGEIQMVRTAEREYDYYIAKLVNVEDQSYAGFYDCGIRRADEVVAGGDVWLYEEEMWLASPSYADHARRIQELFGEEVSVANVRFVSVDGIGDCFYVFNDERELFVPIGEVLPDDKIEELGEKYSSRCNVTYNLDAMRILSEKRLEEHKEFLKKKEAWEKEHPGEEYAIMGDPLVAPPDSYVDHTSVDNINNIREYLGIVDEPKIPSEEERNRVWLYAMIAGVVVLAGAFVVFYGVRRRRSAEKYEPSEW